MTKKLLTFLTLLTLFFGVGWAAEVTFTPSNFSGQGTSSTGSTISATVDGITFASDKGYYYSESRINIYSGGTITISSTVGNIINISITCTGSGTGNYGPSKLSGTGYTAGTGQIGLWQGSAASVSLSANAQVRITQVKVTTETSGSTTTYSLTGTGDNGTVTFSVGGSAVTSAAAGATVTATATANTGYEFSSWTQPTNVTNWSASGNTASFTMPAAPVTVSATFEESSSGGNAGPMIYTPSSSNSGTLTGAPTSSVTAAISGFSGFTSGQGAQRTSNTSPATISFSNLPSNYKVMKIEVEYCTNTSKGQGTISATLNDNAIGNSFTVTKPQSGGTTLKTATLFEDATGLAFNGNLVVSTIATENSIYIYQVRVYYEEIPEKAYDVTVTQATGGTISASPSGEKVANEGDEITLSYEAAAGYQFGAWDVKDASNNTVTVTNNKFTMPASSVTVTATFSKIQYSITNVVKTNGELSGAGGGLNNFTGVSTVGGVWGAQVGDEVTFTANTYQGYQMLQSGISIKDADNNDVSFTFNPNNGNLVTFTMPASNVTVTANFTNYRGTLRLAGHFNGHSAFVDEYGGNTGPTFEYTGGSTDSYSYRAYFTGTDDNGACDYFCLTLDGVAKYPSANGNFWITNLDGTAIDFNLGGSHGNNFRIVPGVYDIVINGALTSMTVTRVTPTITFSPAAGEVEQGTAVSATSSLTGMIAAIKATDSGAAGTVTVGVNTDNGNTWNENETLSTLGSATVYGKAYIGNISVTDNASYTVVAPNTNTQYQRITSETGLVAGKKYIIVSEKKEKAAGFLNSGGKYLDEASVSISNDIATVTSSDVQIFTLGGNSTDGWTFTSSSGIMGANSSKDIVFGDATATNVATISFGTQDLNDGTHNEALITFGTCGHFIHNVNSTRFKTYTSDYNVSMVPVQLYKQVEGTVADVSATPVISPQTPDIKGGKVTVTITPAEGTSAAIYYTTNGNDPDPTNAEQLYSEPFELTGTFNESKTVKAIAVETDKDPSATATFTYKFNAPAKPTFSPTTTTSTEPINVTISSEDGGTIYYVVNPATAPTGYNALVADENHETYSNQITLTEKGTYTIYAAVMLNDLYSGVASITYTISETVQPGEGDFTLVESDNDIEAGREYIIINSAKDKAASAYNSSKKRFTNSENFELTNNDKTASVESDVMVFTLEAGENDGKYYLKDADGNYYTPSTSDGNINQTKTELTVSYWGGYVIITAGTAGSAREIAYNEQGGQEVFGSFTHSTISATGNGTLRPIYLYYRGGSAVATPVITPASKVFYEEFDATITCATQGATIYYTTDGTDPSVNNGTPYSTPVHISKTTTLKAIAVKDGESSGIATAEYQCTMVENIAEYLELPIGTEDIVFKNPVVVQYHYISSSGKSYIYVKDDTGCAYFHQPYETEGTASLTQFENGDIIGANFHGDKDYDEAVSGVSQYAMFTNLEDFAATGYKALAEPELKTVSDIIATNAAELNNHYITIKKVKLSDLYQALSYGGAKYFDIYDETGTIGQDHIGYNKFNIDYESVVDDTNAFYNITGIFTAYNNLLEFHPTEVVKWAEKEVTLRDLCDEGEVNESYTITNNLIGVKAIGTSLWVKDENGQSIHMTAPAAGDHNYEIGEEAGNKQLDQSLYDQSNWLEIVFPTAAAAQSFETTVIKGYTIKGVFDNKTNPKLTLASDAVLVKYGDSDTYSPNYYCAANFYGSQDCAGGEGHGHFFFMNPKPQEVAHIAWAYYQGSNVMIIPPQGNSHEFGGQFTIDLSLNSTQIPPTTGKAYNFDAIIRMVEPTRAEGLGNSNNYKVYPINLTDDVITAVTDVAGKTVAGVKYYNLAGMESDRPFEGVNIIVTTYTDGSRSSAKVLK